MDLKNIFRDILKEFSKEDNSWYWSFGRISGIVFVIMMAINFETINYIHVTLFFVIAGYIKSSQYLELVKPKE